MRCCFIKETGAHCLQEDCSHKTPGVNFDADPHWVKGKRSRWGGGGGGGERY